MLWILCDYHKVKVSLDTFCYRYDIRFKKLVSMHQIFFQRHQQSLSSLLVLVVRDITSVYVCVLFCVVSNGSLVVGDNTSSIRLCVVLSSNGLLMFFSWYAYNGAVVIEWISWLFLLMYYIHHHWLFSVICLSPSVVMLFII